MGTGHPKDVVKPPEKKAGHHKGYVTNPVTFQIAVPLLIKNLRDGRRKARIKFL